MPKESFRALIMEDDPYASDLMLLLLARDYRTKVVAEIPHRLAVTDIDAYAVKRIDVVIIDTETPWSTDFAEQAAARFAAWDKPPRLIFTTTVVNSEMVTRLAARPCFSGYLVKGEVRYGIASAVCLAGSGYCVVTPQVRALVGRGPFPANTLVVRSRSLDEALGETERQILRLGILFNLPQYDIHDEQQLSETWIAKVISRGYAKLRIPDIVDDPALLDELLDDPYINNAKIIGHYQQIARQLPDLLERRSAEKKHGYSRSPKFRGMATLAFHLVTQPLVESWPLTPPAPARKRASA